MKSGLSTIQQTLTPDASAVLAASVAEAAKRNHCQTTPLHVAAALLASPSRFLRNACVRSHPNSSHPLRSRALELCFSVALERLPATVHAGSTETGGAEPGSPAPPVSNALMAALKRAQAHQRRGGPEQQQQPLLAVKVELEQLVISILDDPSVSRVMREARFSSPAVKAAIEQSLLSHLPHAPPLNAYLNPRFVQGNRDKLGIFGNDEMKRISDIFSRHKKRNPILVGGDEPMSIMNDLRMKLKEGKLLDNPEVIQLDKYLVDKARLNDNLRDLGELIEAKINDCGVVVDLGDLKAVVEGGRVAVDDVAKIVARFGDGRLWLIGTATCETYLRCQINYPSMENDWDLQAVPIATRSPFPGMFSSSMKTFQMPNVIPRRVLEIVDPTRTSRCCPQCSENYEKELAKFVANEFEKSSLEIRSEPAQPSLPQWLQNAKSDNRRDSRPLDQSKTKDQEIVFDQKTKELEKKWSDKCLRVHPNFPNNFGSQSVKPPTTLYNPKLLLHQPLQQKSPPNKALGASLQLNSCSNINNIPEKSNSPPRCPVRTDLVLGRPKFTEMPQESTEEDGAMDLLGCISSYPVEKYAKVLDTDSYERLLKGLMEKVWWQKDAASKVAYAVTKPKVGDGKRSGTLSKGDTWILFTGPDKVGQKKMASVISDHICGSNPIVICLGSKRSDEEIAMNFRGKTVLDRIVEAVKRNPFSVIMLEDIDEADIIIRGSIKRAMDRGRLSDSYGREISLGNVLFILTANWLPDNFGKLRSDQNLDESKIASFSKSGWQLRLRVSEKRPKRRPDWLHERVIKPRRELGSGLSLDLNLMADFDDDLTNGSPNSSDLTTEHGDDPISWPSITSVPIELANIIDETVVFKPVEIDYVKNEIQKKIIEKFSDVIEDISLEVEENALEKILGGVWLGRTGLEEWGEKVLIPSFHKIKTLLPLDHNIVIRLEIDNVSGIPNVGDWLPTCIRV